MSASVALQQLTQAMIIVMWLSMPPIVVASAVGIIVSLLQALTQIQEQTLSFAIKLVAVAATIAAMSSLLGAEIFTYTINLFNNFPKMT